MSLLQEILQDAVDSTNELSVLLRKCKVLAACLGSQPMENWLVWESNGYPNDAKVPDYRTWRLEMKGNFAGSFGRQLNRWRIPMISLPDDVVPLYEAYECRESIATIEYLFGAPHTGIFQVSTGDLASLLGDKVYEDFSCLQAWGEYGAAKLSHVLNSVRDRLVDFCLALQKEGVDLPDSPNSSGNFPSSSTVTQIFNTTIHGGTANLLGTSHSPSITINTVVENDIDALRDFLISNDVAPDDFEELEAALKLEPEPSEDDRFGPKVSAWAAKMYQKAADGSWKIGLATAGGILAKAISKYYGLE